MRLIIQDSFEVEDSVRLLHEMVVEKSRNEECRIQDERIESNRQVEVPSLRIVLPCLLGAVRRVFKPHRR
jgi:hypothetical protein